MRERVKQFHGTFELESTPGQGTTIKVILPIAKAAARGRYG
jgi:signal transduction histidine kinase